MPVYFSRKAPKLWRKICIEVSIEVSLLAENWKFVLAGLVFQYIHGLAAHGVHYLHRPGPTIQDVGFLLIPELGEDKAYMSETIFVFIFCSFVLACQILRIMTFYATQLPGPNYHCHEGSKLARLPPPDSALEVIFINCGGRGADYIRYLKQLAWLLALIQSLLIIASRKHYTVDIVVAWYTVNLTVFFLDKKLPELPDRSSSSTSPRLPP